MAYTKVIKDTDETYEQVMPDFEDFTCECGNICAANITCETPGEAMYSKKECEVCGKQMCSQCARVDMGKAGDYEVCNECLNNFAALKFLADDYSNYHDNNVAFLANQVLELLERFQLEQQESTFWKERYTKAQINLQIKSSI